ncbi:alkylated DNA repair protein alkB homolog 8-like isoform X1 [Trichogramma pretiosum]|uniref:alkylated DNA repair protein alkB homolog 8-like isoform X1 n=1 Tax=Trichogramma pretiosum TaxID=7493 RepID=UPI0006C971BE|nr:alkylated DNA repair protein alkB homolog 8-like isoform X1 [Trichogramma pretiosum]
MNSEESLWSKADKKLNRARKRMSHLAEFSIEPTRKVILCNLGLANVLEKECFEQYVSQALPEIRYTLSMPAGETYCFFDFDSVKEAQDFYSQSHGKLKFVVNERKVPFCLGYVKSVADKTLNHCPPPSHYPNGLRLIKNFVTPDEEKLLLDDLDWNDNEEKSILKNRRVKHFGYRFCYDSNTVKKDATVSPIPEKYGFLLKSFEDLMTENVDYNQLTINRYLPGQGIPNHVDNNEVFDEPILSLSLNSSYVMDFCKCDSLEQRQKVSIDLPQRSLLIMSGEAFREWTHGIAQRQNDVVETDSGDDVRKRGIRVSFTFRRVKKSYDSNVDNSSSDNKDDSKSLPNLINPVSTITDKVASKLEETYVHEVYESISDHFSKTRHTPWHNVETFVKNLKPGSLLLDVGCGNGKYLHVNPNICKFGIDRTMNLLQICRERNFEVARGDCLYLPYKENSLDAVICIAVIHHLSTEERRRQAIVEIIRILRPGGKALIYVWAKQQSRGSVNSKYLKSGKTKKDTRIKAGEKQTPTKVMHRDNEISITLPVHENRTEFDHRDLLVPWKKEEESFLRFYHVFHEGELRELCETVPESNIEEIYYDQGNWCAILEKK